MVWYDNVSLIWVSEFIFVKLNSETVFEIFAIIVFLILFIILLRLQVVKQILLFLKECVFFSRY